MSKFSRRVLAVLTVAAITSFVGIHAQNGTGPGSVFRDSAGWSFADGVVTLTGAPSRDNLLSTRHALADSVTALEFRAPRGARADLYVQGRYGVPLEGTGDWQSVAIRFRAPRMDAGFNKVANAFMLDVRVGNDMKRSVVYELGPHVCE